MLVLHRRAGKTTAVLHHLQRDALTNPDSLFAYIAPTYKQAKLIAWKILKQIAQPVPGVEFNETDLTATYPGNGQIRLLGADNPDSLRGIALWGAAFDEYSQQPANIYTEIVSKALADHDGYAIWFGTPKGKNEFYRLYQEGLKHPDLFLTVFRTIDDTITQEEDPQGHHEIENLTKALEQDKRLLSKGIITNDEFQQEWYCNFDAGIKGAYYSEQVSNLRAAGRLKAFEWDRELPVHTVWDLGIADAMSIGFYQKASDNQIRMIDYMEGTEKGLDYYIRALQQKPYIYGTHFAPHDIEVRELVSGKSRRELARNLGINFQVIPDVSVAEGIDAGRRIFPRLWINSAKCEQFIDYLSQYHKEWDEKRGAFKDRPKHDFTSHAADVHRYMALVEDQFYNSVISEDFNLLSHDYA